MNTSITYRFNPLCIEVDVHLNDANKDDERMIMIKPVRHNRDNQDDDNHGIKYHIKYHNFSVDIHIICDCETRKT